MNIPKSALFLELGWEPVYAFMNRQRVAYYARFQNLADDRLCKIIFDLLGNSEHSEYHMYLKKIFIDLGLDHYVHGAIDLQVFRSFYGQTVRQSEYGKVLSKNSLSMYKNCRVALGKQAYLSDDVNFEATRLKLLARTNCLSINATLYRMSLSGNDRCSVCSLHSVEDLQHFALECHLYHDIRTDIIEQIENVFASFHVGVKFEELPSYKKLLYLFGDYGYDISEEMGKELDLLAKMYLVKAFNARKCIVEN